MLKNIREGAIENPWFFRIIMLGVAAVFAVSMGWWGFGGGDREDNMIAVVGESRISIDEYKRAYQAASKFYRELFQGDYDDEALRKRVIEELVERKLWIQEAHQMRLAVSDQDLKESVTSMVGFQRDGEFDAALYQRALSFEHYTPESFEEKQREALLVKKVQAIVKAGVSLTPTEVQEAEEGDQENSAPNRTLDDRSFQKKERAVRAYIMSLKEKAVIDIKEEFL